MKVLTSIFSSFPILLGIGPPASLCYFTFSTLCMNLSKHSDFLNQNRREALRAGLIAKNHDFIQIFDLAIKSGPPWADCDQKPNPILCNYILLNIFDC